MSNESVQQSSGLPSNSAPVFSNWRSTSTKLRRSEWSWDVSISRLTPGKGTTCSPFTIPGQPETTWQVALGVTKNTRNEEHVNVVCFLLKHASQRQSPRWTMAAIWFLDSQRLPVRRQVGSPFPLAANTRGISHCFARSITRERARELLTEDKLTIVFSVTLHEESLDELGSSRESGPKTVDMVLDFGKMFKELKYTDVVFQVDGHQFLAHRCVLASRSPVFAAIFDNDIAGRDGIVEIDGISKDVFKAILCFIYTDKVDNVKSMASLLLAAAEKYELTRLKAMAEAELCSDLTTENVCERLALGYVHRASTLRKRALRHITANAAYVAKSAAWKSLIKKHPVLSVEAFEALAVGNSA